MIKVKLIDAKRKLKSKENKNTDENEIPKNEKNKIKKEVEKKDEN